jgi:hypothetical protein
MKKSIYYRDRYKDIGYEVFEGEPFSRCYGDWFCGYIYLPARRLTEEGKRLFFLEPKVSRFSDKSQPYLTYDYMNLDVYTHGGVTFYELEGCKVGDDDFRCARIGWDYNHLGDEDQVHTPLLVEMDCKQAIDSVSKYLLPEVKP